MWNAPLPKNETPYFVDATALLVEFKKNSKFSYEKISC